MPGWPQHAIHLEAAALAGRIVSVRRIAPWTAPGRSLRLRNMPSEMQSAFPIVVTLFAVSVVGSLILARRNLRLGRGDRRGAARLAWVTFGLTLVSWLIISEEAAPEEQRTVAFLATVRQGINHVFDVPARATNRPHEHDR